MQKFQNFFWFEILTSLRKLIFQVILQGEGEGGEGEGEGEGGGGENLQIAIRCLWDLFD